MILVDIVGINRSNVNRGGYLRIISFGVKCFICDMIRYDKFDIEKYIYY
jgi:hypothetical protein